MNIRCWNIQSLNTKEYEVFGVQNQLDVKIAVLTEAKRKRMEINISINTFTFYSSIDKDK